MFIGVSYTEKNMMLKEYVRDVFDSQRKEFVDTLDHHYKFWDARNSSIQIKHNVFELPKHIPFPFMQIVVTVTDS